MSIYNLLLFFGNASIKRLASPNYIDELHLIDSILEVLPQYDLNNH